MNKNWQIGLCLVLVLGLVTYFFVGNSTNRSINIVQKNPTTDKQSIIAFSRSQSKIYTETFHAKQSVNFDDKTITKIIGAGPFTIGERSINIRYIAHLKAYIDMSKFTNKCVSINGDKVTVRLPSIEIEKTGFKVEEIVKNIDLLRFDFNEQELNKLISAGENDLSDNLKRYFLDNDVLNRSREEAKDFFVDFIVSLGYDEENIDVDFDRTIIESVKNTLAR
ncbi:MAG: DUF4230 domain-containing protein [Bacteroidales bacterium]|nr:DUF4230 domain-containing protein [Bacteroidales bacterium]